MRLVVSPARAFQRHTHTSGYPVSGSGLGFFQALLALVPTAISAVTTIAQSRYASQATQAQYSGQTATQQMLMTLQARDAEAQRQRDQAAQDAQRAALEQERYRLQMAQISASQMPGWVVPTAAVIGGVVVLKMLLPRRRAA